MKNKIIVSFWGSGKSTLTSKHPEKYIDFDNIFKEQNEIAIKMSDLFISDFINKNEGKIIIINIGLFLRTLEATSNKEEIKSAIEKIFFLENTKENIQNRRAILYKRNTDSKGKIKNKEKIERLVSKKSLDELFPKLCDIDKDKIILLKENEFLSDYLD